MGYGWRHRRNKLRAAVHFRPPLPHPPFKCSSYPSTREKPWAPSQSIQKSRSRLREASRTDVRNAARCSSTSAVAFDVARAGFYKRDESQRKAPPPMKKGQAQTTLLQRTQGKGNQKDINIS